MKKRLQNYLLSKYFHVVIGQDLFKDLDPKQKGIIRDDALKIVNSRTWNWMLDEMRLVAEKKMFLESESWEEVQGGKWMLYTIDVLDKKLKNLAK